MVGLQVLKKKMVRAFNA